MTTAVQHRRGTTAEHAVFTGLEGELTIDTTKDTAVIHDGTLAGGYPLAKENLANVTTSGLSSIDGASTASDDKFFIYDQSATSLKTITRAELNNAMEQDALANVSITGGTINGTTIGGTTAAAISATTLTTSSTVTHNGGSANGVCFLNGSKVLTSGSALTFDGTNLGVTGVLDVDAADGVVGVRLRQNATIGAGTEYTVKVTENTGVTFDSTDGGTVARSFIWTQVGSEQMRLTSTGLGIGNSSPTAKLDVTGTAAISGAVTLSGGTANGVAYLNGSKVLTTGSALTFDGTNLGVGTATPTAITGTARVLDVVGSSYGFGLFGNGTVTAQIAGDGANGLSLIGSRSNHPVSFLLNNAEAMRLTSTGLGIGTSSPEARLSTVSSASGLGAQINTSLATSGSTALQLGGYLTGFASNTGVTLRAYTNHGATTASSLAFEVNGTTEAMRIDSSGNLGLGVTPSAWTNSFGVIQGLGGWSISHNGANSNSVDFLSNAYRSGGANTYLYVASSNATRYQQLAGSHAWYTAPSGTAGNAISFTQAMTLDASGNLLVGTTSATVYPTAGVQLLTGSQGIVAIGHTGTTDGAVYQTFAYAGGAIGSITQNGTTAVSYNTSSDYRLKNITGPITTSGAYIDSLNPVEGTWKADGSTFVGLIAHEVQEASRTNVATGVKDGEEMQGMDYSSAEIIANLIAEVKSLRTRVAALEAA